jgi:hypothetical protein
VRISASQKTKKHNDGQKQLKWEAAFISEISNAGKDHTLRVALEYEF